MTQKKAARARYREIAAKLAAAAKGWTFGVDADALRAEMRMLAAALFVPAHAN